MMNKNNLEKSLQFFFNLQLFTFSKCNISFICRERYSDVKCFEFATKFNLVWTNTPDMREDFYTEQRVQED